MTVSARARAVPTAVAPNGTTGRILGEIADRAAAADRGECDLSGDVAALREAGILTAMLPPAFGGSDLGMTAETAQSAVTLLRRLGRANLSVGRIVEGHMNAIKLIRLYGSREQQERAFSAALAGSLFGVWGADAARPVELLSGIDPDAPGSRPWRLSGSKRFASGLGLVDRALVTVRLADAAPQLCLLEVTDRRRMDHSTWRTSGMRATGSGDYCFDGVAVTAGQRIGAPGDLLREPHFEGGVWRYAALHVGGIEAIAEAVRQAIRARGQTGDPQQLARMAQLAEFCGTGRLWVESAARRVEAAGPRAGDVDDAVAHALLAREAVERAALACMAVADRALGAASFFEGHPVERLRRDLAFFLRQANLDGKRDAAARTVALGDRAIGELW